MGMFDYLLCEYPLPLDGMTGVKWQTKDLTCELSTYRITAEGVLEVRFGGEWETALCPHWLIVNFHESFDREKDEAGRVLSSRRVAFCAHFTYGKLDGIDLTEDKIHIHPTDEEIERRRREMDVYMAEAFKSVPPALEDLEGPFSTHDPSD